MHFRHCIYLFINWTWQLCEEREESPYTGPVARKEREESLYTGPVSSKEREEIPYTGPVSSKE